MFTPIPTGPTSVQNVIPAYVYVEYSNDDAIQAIFSAYNTYAQAYVNYFNNLNLPIYTSGYIVGALLDWVAEGIYGITRPGLPSPGTPPQGPFNTWTLNSLPINGYRPGINPGYTATSDDTFKRIITWAFYKGDGKVFTPRWLKRRINRFLNGVAGTDVTNDETYAISVYPTGFKAWTIKLTTSDEAKLFQSAVDGGILELPLQIDWTVLLI